jgi:hypothetical protein
MMEHFTYIQFREQIFYYTDSSTVIGWGFFLVLFDWFRGEAI